MIKVKTISKYNTIITELDGEVTIHACESKEEYESEVVGFLEAGRQNCMRAYQQKLSKEVLEYYKLDKEEGDDNG